MKSVQDYLNLVTSQYQKLPNFNAMLSFMVSLPVQVQSLMTSMMTTLFDLSTPPVGQQLDIIGEWVGISRNVNVPITGVFFTWNDTTYATGWNYGSWRPQEGDVNIVSLPDDVYLNLILAKIAANNWDGTTNGAYEIWAQVFPQFTILIQDLCNMSYNLIIIGGIVDSVTLALITGGYIELRPEGVRINEYYVSIDGNPAFCWDLENSYCAGWNQGSWLLEVAPTNTPT